MRASVRASVAVSARTRTGISCPNPSISPLKSARGVADGSNMRRERYLLSRYKLTLRLGLIVLFAMGAFAFTLTRLSNEKLSDASADAQRSELLAMARSFSGDFRAADIDDPVLLQKRLDGLERLNPELDRATILRPPKIGPGEERMFRVASSSSPGTSDQLNDAIDEVTFDESGEELTGALARDDFVYADKSSGGEHFSELHYPLENGRGEAVGLLTLVLDLSREDSQLASEQSDLLIAAAILAITVAVLTMLLFGRSVLRPLAQLRSATRRLKAGERDTRLDWRRQDEIGFLARDFDDMAAELDSQHQQVETLGQYREAQLAVASVLAEGGDVDSTVPEVLRAMGESFGWVAGAYWTPEEGGGTLACRAFWHRPDRDVGTLESLSREHSLNGGDELPSRVYATAKPAVIEDLGHDRGSTRAIAAEHAGLKGSVALPIVRGGEVVGVIEFFSPKIKVPEAKPAGVSG
jgi:HAMP domain-containing protein